MFSRVKLFLYFELASLYMTAYFLHYIWRFRVIVFNATFNNISDISYIVGVPGENHRPVASHWQTLSHNVVSSTPCQGLWEGGSAGTSVRGPESQEGALNLWRAPLLYYVLIETKKIRQLMKSSPWNYITNITHIHMEKSMVLMKVYQ